MRKSPQLAVAISQVMNLVGLLIATRIRSLCSARSSRHLDSLITVLIGILIRAQLYFYSLRSNLSEQFSIVMLLKY